MHYTLLLYCNSQYDARLLEGLKQKKKKKKDAEEHQLEHRNPVMEHPKERKRSPSRALIIFLLSLWMQRRERSVATQKGWGVHDLSYPDRPRLGMIIDALLRSVRRSRSDWYRAPSRRVGEESEILLSARCSSSLPRLALLLRLQALSVGDEAKAQESRDPLPLKVDTSCFCFSWIPCRPMASWKKGQFRLWNKKNVENSQAGSRRRLISACFLVCSLLAFSSWHSALMFCPFALT